MSDTCRRTRAASAGSIRTAAHPGNRRADLNLFISYRRSESSGYSGRIYDRLRAALPDSDVFIDVERIDPGRNWRDELAERIRAADAVLVLVGDEWRTLADAAGRRRLDDPQDVTRWELDTALAQHKRIVPILLDDAPPLKAHELPASLRALAPLQAARIRHEAFDAGLEDLIARLTGKRLRDEALAAQGRWRIERAGRWTIPALVVLVVLLAWVRLFDLFTLDTRIATWTLALADAVAPVPLDERIVLVGIDASQDAQAPQMRARYGAAIVALASAGARSVVLDIHFHAPRAADAALASAMREARNLGADVFFGFVETQAGKARAVPELAAAATAVGLACAGRRLGYALSIPIAFDLRRDAEGWHANPAPALSLLGAAGNARIAAVDADNGLLTVEAAGKISQFPFSTLSAEVAAAQGCTAIAPGTRAAELILRISSAQTLRSRRFSLEDVVSGRIPPGRMAGRTAVIGFETPEETFRIAHGLERQTRFGYELQADAINMLMQRRIARFVTPAWQAVIAGIFATLGAAIGVRFRKLGRGSTAVMSSVLAVTYFALAVALAANEDLLLNTAYDISAVVIAYALFRHLARRWLQ